MRTRDKSALVLTAFLAAVLAFAAAPARADWTPSGALGATLLIDVESSGDARLGGAATVDLYKSIGIFRIGFATGLGALTRGNDEDNRVFAPLGLSMALRLPPGDGRIGVHGTARVGVWGGADFDGLVGGGFVTAGLTLDIRFRGGLELGLGADLWALFGGEQRTFVAPVLALRWNPEP